MAEDGVKIKIYGDDSEFQKSLGNLGNVAKKGIGVLTKAVTGATAALAAGAGAAIKFGSDFQAGMSQVAATMNIDQSSDSFKKLSDAAKEAGETTKFSASQAAEALNYLALAGYDADKSISALPTVLDLAAAGGLDLGYASDMVTDSMSALGLGTDQLAGFVDELARTSQKSNTSVGQLGEAILTVGGTAKTLAGGTNELNMMLGVLADNGIKGSEGGTALRNVILSLSAPTDKAAGALKELGINAFDGDGKLKPLNETFEEMNKKLSTLSDQEKTEALNSIFNKVDLKSVNALLGTSSERFNQLSSEIANSEGAASDMAKTMNDNLQGDFTVMQSAAEGLGIAFFETFGDGLRTAVQNSTKSIGELTTSVKNGTLNTALKSLSKSVSGFITQLSTLAAKYLPIVIEKISWLISNIGTITRLVLVSVAAWKSYTSAVSALKILGSVKTWITEVCTAVSSYTSGVKLATLAQAAWNAVMSANPIALLIGLIGAATAALVIWNVTKREGKSETDKLVDSVKKEYDAYEDLKASKEEQATSDLAQISNTRNLYNELRGLADANGVVDEKNRARASFILGELNNALGTEYSMTDGVINKYGDLCSSIDNLIAKKQSQILLEAHEEDYKQAILNKTDAVKAQESAYKDLQAAQEAYADMMSRTNGEFTRENAAGCAAIIQSLQSAQEKYDETAYVVNKYAKDISAYQDAATAEQEGNYDKVISILDKGNKAYQNASKIAEEQSKLTKEQIGQNYADAVRSVEVAYNNLSKYNNAENQRSLSSAIEYAANIRKAYEAAGGAIVDGQVTGLEGKTIKLTAKTEEIGKAGAEAFEKTNPAYDVAGQYAVMGAVNGMNQRQRLVWLAGYALGKAGVDGFNAGQNAHSPSVDYENAAEYSIAGLQKGIKENRFSYIKDMFKLARDGKTEVQKVMDEMNKELLESEKLYAAESLRIEQEKEEKEFQEKLAAAKTKEEKQKLYKEREKKRQEEDNKKYLDDLRKTAEKERKIYEAKLKDREKEIELQIEAVEKLKEKVAETYEQLANDALDKIDEIAQAQDKLADKLKSYGELYEKVEVKKFDSETGKFETVDSYYQLADLSSQTAELEAYANALEAVRERGSLPQGFFEELRDMSIEEGTIYANTLLNADDEAFNGFLAAYKAKSEAADRISKELYSNESENLKKELEETFSGVPDRFFDFGLDSIEKFEAGFMSKLDGVIQTIKNTIDSAIGGITITAALAPAGAENTNVTNYNDNSVYNLVAGNGSSAHENIQAYNDAKNYEKKKMGWG